jgi:hypothetical protein
MNNETQRIMEARADIRSALDVFKLIAELPEDMLQHALAPHPVQDQRTGLIDNDD